VERVGGYIRGRKNGQTCGAEVGPQDRQASQTAFRLPLKRENPCPFFGLQEKGWRQTASQFTSARQSRPKYRDLQYLQIGVKIRIREKSWSQKKKKLQLSPIIREV
jgi:hypothetical protein